MPFPKTNKTSGFSPVHSLIFWLGSLLLTVVHFVCFDDRKYLLFSIFLLLWGFLFLLRSHRFQMLPARELVIIASLSALSVLGRIAFYWLPQFKPVTAIIIIAGAVLTPEAGLIIGMFSALASNIFFGQGPWTLYQMFAWALIGYLSGLLMRNRTKITVMVYGFFITFLLYGGILNFASVLMFSSALTLKALKASCLSGIPFDLVHAISTVVFLFFLYNPIKNKLNRVITKYGLFQEIK